MNITFAHISKASFWTRNLIWQLLQGVSGFFVVNIYIDFLMHESERLAWLEGWGASEGRPIVSLFMHRNAMSPAHRTRWDLRHFSSYFTRKISPVLLF